MNRTSSRIADLNDLLRTTFLTGKVVITGGIASLPDDHRSAVIAGVQAFSAFTPDNDPYGEHDFGNLDVAGVGKVFWKVDYYNPTLTGGSEDPADPARTCRVLTIMLAREY